MELRSSHPLTIRFSEVDSMDIVWHGAYALYFEDAREQFGKDYDLGYMTIFNNGYYAPLVELTFHYKHPLRYETPAQIDIIYRPSLAAKIIFDYEIYTLADHVLVATGRSVQVFLDSDYQLVWYDPPFYQQWKARWQQHAPADGL